MNKFIVLSVFITAFSIVYATRWGALYNYCLWEEEKGDCIYPWTKCPFVFQYRVDNENYNISLLRLDFYTRWNRNITHYFNGTEFFWGLGDDRRAPTEFLPPKYRHLGLTILKKNCSYSVDIQWFTNVYVNFDFMQSLCDQKMSITEFGLLMINTIAGRPLGDPRNDPLNWINVERRNYSGQFQCDLFNIGDICMDQHPFLRMRATWVLIAVLMTVFLGCAFAAKIVISDWLQRKNLHFDAHAMKKFSTRRESVNLLGKI